MGKKSFRERNKTNKHRTLEDRRMQVLNIQQKLQNIQLDSRLPEIITLESLMETFVETGESCSGKIPLSNSNKVIHYIFSNRTSVDCKVQLLVTK